MSRIDAILTKMLKKTNVVGTTREVIYNKYVLYLVFLIALVNLLNSIVNQDYLYCILFALIGFLIAFFNKNMTVILVLTIAFATLLNAILTGSGIKIEGFDDSAKDKKESESKSDSDSSNKEPLEEKDGESTSSIAKPEPTKAAATSPKVLMENLKVQALDLQDAQKEIISGFQQIEPHMQRAESLIGSIQETAQTIQGMRNK